MDNTFFLYTDKGGNIEIARFHICTWEFDNNSSLIEFGIEINKESLSNKDNVALTLFAPWLSNDCQFKDLYEKLSISSNSRFIFNDSVKSTDSLDGGANKLGVIHKFDERNSLCILPIKFNLTNSGKLNLEINLNSYNNYNGDKHNIYLRFYVKPKFPFFSTRKRGIGKSTIIYDIKVNERRNLPDTLLNEFNNKEFCKINDCFSFNILPNRYDMVFFEDSLRNVRTLEYSSFDKYLGDVVNIPKDELIVVFNKKAGLDSFSFFSIYANEKIGPGQFALAILINIICGILLFLPAYRRTFNPELKLCEVFAHVPVEIYIALLLAIFTLGYFLWPSIFLKGFFSFLSQKGKTK